MMSETTDPARLVILAEKARALADTMQDLDAKREMLNIAATYLILARRAEFTSADGVHSARLSERTKPPQR
jgi:hypothetical protein